MLRRPVPGTRPGDQAPTTATSAGFGLVSKPFKPPSALVVKRSDLPARKRKAVSYRDAGGDQDDADGDADVDAENGDGGERGKKAKTGTGGGGGYAMGNKEYDGNGVLGGMGRLCMRKFPVFKVKEKGAVFGKR